MRDEDIKVGDVLRVRSWDDMVFEYGTELFGGITRIKTPSLRFSENMKNMCGLTFTVRKVLHDALGRTLYCSCEGVECHTQYSFNMWSITADMLEPFFSGL